MKIDQLSGMLDEIRSTHGNIEMRCGQHRIGGIMLIKTVTPPVAVIVQKKVGSPIEAIPPLIGTDRRKAPRRRHDD